MKLGFVSDSLGGIPFIDMLEQGIAGIEVNTGGWSTAPHFDLAGMKSSAKKRTQFLQAFTERGLEVISLNANGNRNPLHPTDKKQAECLADTIRMAGEMGNHTACARQRYLAQCPRTGHHVFTGKR